MSRFQKLSQTVWHCQYHIVFTPKYRYKVLTGAIAKEAEESIRTYSEQQGAEIKEINVQRDHVHVLALVPPKISLSEYVGTLKGRTAIRIFNKFKHLKKKPYWGNHFWTRGYCVDTVGLDVEMVQKYIKYQENRDKKH